MNFTMMKCLIQGPARVGKTHVKALIMKKKLEEGISPSTDCVEQAVRAVCTDTFAGDGETWKEVSPNELKEMIVKEMKNQHQLQSTIIKDDADSPSTGHGDNADSLSTGHGDNSDSPSTGHGDNPSTDHTDSPSTDHGDNADSPSTGHGDNADSPSTGHGDNADSPSTDHGDNADSPSTDHGDNADSPSTDHGDNADSPSTDHGDNPSTDHTDSPSTDHGDNADSPSTDHGDNADSPSTDHGDNADSPSTDHGDNADSPSTDHGDNADSPSTDHGESADSPSTDHGDNADSEHLIKELMEIISNCERVKMHQKWIYFIDSGGQPQFHNVFQAFIQNTSILLLVFSLAEKLSDYNKHLFQDKEGHDHSKNSDNAAPRIDVVMKSIASALFSTVSEEKRKIFFVGTHRDVYENNHPPSQGVLCSLKRFGCRLLCHRYESIEMKEQQLREIFGIKQSQEEIKEEEIQTTSTQGSTILFPVNGLQAEEGDFDDEVVVNIRQQIFSLFKETKVERIPLRWFLFQLALDQKVLTYKKCRSIAKHFHINDSSTDNSSTDNKDPIDVALAFLQKCSLLLVYKKLDLVITDPTALLSRFSTMVRKFYSVTNALSGNVAENRLAKKAIFSTSVFEKLQSDDSSEMEVLTCEKLISIFECLLIAVEVSITGRGKYFFVPALLPCSPSPPPEAKVCILQLFSTVPLVFLFSDKCTPSGLFCAVVVKLLSSKDWEIDADTDIYSNAVTLLHTEWLPEVKVSLIDSFKYYEVHCKIDDRLKEVKKKVESAIESVIKEREFKCSPKIAFFKCKKKRCKRLALLLEDGTICCHCKRYEAKETKRERKWIEGNVVI